VIISRRLRWADHVARMEESRSALKILTGKFELKRQLGRPRRRHEDDFSVSALTYKSILFFSPQYQAKWTSEKSLVKI
jgi:hypothetical protein